MKRLIARLRGNRAGGVGREATRLVHGEQGLAAALRITEALFAGEPDRLSETDFEQLRLDGMPSSELSDADLVDKPLTNLLAECGISKSRSRS